MSQANVDFLCLGYDALQRGDIAAFKALARDRLEDDFEFHQVWDGQVLRGYEGTIEWLEDTSETWAEYSQSVQEILDLGDQVLVVVRIEARGGGSGVPVNEELAVPLDLRGPPGRGGALPHVTRRSARLARLKRTLCWSYRSP